MSLATRLTTLPAPARRTIALSSLLLLLALGWLLVVIPVRTLLLSQQEWRADITQRIARDRGLTKSAAQLREVSTTVSGAPIRARLFDAAAAIAVDDQLQNDLRAAMLQSAVEPTTFKVLPGVTAHGLRQHRVEFASVMTVDQLRAMLTFLGQQPHYVRIERLQVEAPAAQRPDENPRLNLLIEAQGFALDRATSSANTRVARAY